MIGVEIYLSDWIAIYKRIDPDFVLSRLKILEWRDESPRLKRSVLEWPRDRGLASPLIRLDELVDGTDIHVILVRFLEYKIFINVIGFVDADKLTFSPPVRRPPLSCGFSASRNLSVKHILNLLIRQTRDIRPCADIPSYGRGD